MIEINDKYNTYTYNILYNKHSSINLFLKCR